MDKCFIIQPFDDNGKFDRRYEDIFYHAITKAELEPYRVDKDLSVRIPIEEIENGIRESSIVFAEITTDNPNVWYELGFAFACFKDVVMVCSNERIGKFPFDIQHRQVIKYQTDSKSDFENLEVTITNKILALRQSTKTVKTLQTTPVIETEGLKSHEIAILIFMIENQFIQNQWMSIWHLKNEMNKAGYTDVATSIGIRTLNAKGLIETRIEHNQWNNDQEYPAAQLTQTGEKWMLNNQDLLEFRQAPTVENKSNEIIDDLPF